MEDPRMGKSSMGTGIAGGAADILKMRPTWQAEQIEAQLRGEPKLPFEEWMKSQGANTSALPRG